MHDEVSEAMRETLMRAGAVLQKHIGHFNEPFLVWRKQDNGWCGTYESRPSLMNIFAAAQPEIKGMDARFLAAFRERHPRFAGMLSFQTIGGGSFMHQPGFIVSQAMNTLWQRYGTFQPRAGAVEAVIQEFSDFVDRPVVRFQFTAQLLNFEMELDAIPLPEGLVIRRLSEQEVTAIHGGCLWHLSMSRQNSFSPHEYTIEGEYDETMVFGEMRDAPEARRQVRRLLDTAVLALRTFKEGRVGYDQVRFSTVRFCPVLTPSLGYGDIYVPPGRYSISNAEVESLRHHADLVFACKDASMQMACARLADAENRTRPEDRIVDAVVGMESILLAAIDKGDRRGELSFRFSLNYSTLFDVPERKLAAYKVARDLYGLRSVVAHGAVIDEEKLKISGEKVSLDAAGKRATEVLRGIVNFFLPESRALYKNAEFWQRRYFGLPDA